MLIESICAISLLRSPRSIRRRICLSRAERICMSLCFASEVGRCCPMIRRYRVAVGEEGLHVEFIPVESETMLSAIRIVKVY